MRKIKPINITSDGCAFAIRTGYERHAYLNGMGGGFYPATGVMEIYETDSIEHGQGRDLQDDNNPSG